jgi:glycosyltransferase involved in cell wall biosynthesis
MDYKIIVEKEYTKLPENKPTIGMCMMVKNEHKRLIVSLMSLVNQGTHVDALIMYDTGSTDDTLEIIQKFTNKYKINLYLIQGSFVDFSTSRNVLLTYAEKVPVHYLLLLDCNDELQGGKELRKITEEFFTQDTNGFLVCQKWWSGHFDKYFNVRLVKNRCGWRYSGVVHEWLYDSLSPTDQPRVTVFKLDDRFILYQDRTKDDDKSSKRFKRDKELLLGEYKKNPKDGRTVFYLAQTCQCLEEQEEALYYSKIRLDLGGFEEEIFHSMLRCANTSLKLNLGWDEAQKWYLKAYEHSKRAEPIVSIADYYRHKKVWHMSFMYLREACELQYPENCLLFVDSGIYDYYRWHLLGIVGFYVGKYHEGKMGAQKAIDAGTNLELDKGNLKHYLEHEKTSTVTNSKKLLEDIRKELQNKFPKMNKKQLELKANNIYKNQLLNVSS